MNEVFTSTRCIVAGCAGVIPAIVPSTVRISSFIRGVTVEFGCAILVIQVEMVIPRTTAY